MGISVGIDLEHHLVVAVMKEGGPEVLKDWGRNLSPLWWLWVTGENRLWATLLDSS